MNKGSSDTPGILSKKTSIKGSSSHRAAATSAKIVRPPNILKTKVGIGGLPDITLKKADNLIKENSISFEPAAQSYLAELLRAIDRVSYASDDISRNELVHDIIKPVLQLRANGQMFGYRIITEMSENFLGFINNLQRINGESIEIMQAYHTSVSAVLQKQLKNDGGRKGKELAAALEEAYHTYISHKEEFFDIDTEF